MSGAESRSWWRVLILWTLEGGEETRYAYVTKDTENMAVFAALNALIVSNTLAAGDTVKVLACDAYTRTRSCQIDELTEAT